VASATLVTVTVTVLGVGTVPGAVYSPLSEMVPKVEFPLLTWFTLHVTAVLLVPVSLTVNCWVFPLAGVAFAGETLIETDAAVTVTFADADLVVSATLVAVTVTVLGVGTALGAVYSPISEMVPTVEFPPFTLFTLHSTALPIGPARTAVNCCFCPVSTVADAGEIIEAAETVTFAEADLVVSASLVAVTVTVLGLGTELGAVYSPVLLIVPRLGFPSCTPFTLQITEVFAFPVTVAVNC